MLNHHRNGSPIEGSLQAIARLNKAGYKVAIATNQSGVGRGYYTEETLHSIHEKLRQSLAVFGGCIDGIFYCPHTPDDHCDCRKPEPGMLLTIAQTFNCDLTQSVFVGDSWRDMQAAKAVGCQPILVRTGHGEQSLEALQDTNGIKVYDCLAAVVDDFLLCPPELKQVA